MSKRYVQTNTFYLAGSGVIVGATSIVLTSFTDIYGNVLTMTDFGDTGYITLEPDTTNEEAATFTGVVANANNTYTLTGVKTNLAKSPYTETSGLVRAHSGGTKVVVTDNVAFWNTFGNTANTNTWADTQTFSVPAVQATDPTLSTQVANKSYVDGVAIAGAPKATDSVYGITKLSVAAVSPTAPIAVGDNDGRVPSQTENDALVGTSGTPSTTNKYVTNDDTATAATASKVARRLAGGNITVVTESQANNTTNAASTAYVDTAKAAAIAACASVFKNGVTTKDMTAASASTTVIAHGLGTTPKRVRLNALLGSITYVQSVSVGSYNGTTTSGIFSGSNNSTDRSGNSTTNVLSIIGSVSGSQQDATIAVDATNITLTWTKTGSPTGTAQIIWEAEG